MIGKSRQPTPRAVFGQGCGVLQHSPPPGSYRHERYAPGAALAAWVQHFWIESWDWGGATPQSREVLPHPCVHLVFVPGRSRVLGVQLSRFVRELTGRGRVVGVKFRPGAFYPFVKRPVSELADASLPLAELFAGAAEAERDVLASDDDGTSVAAATRFLGARLPPQDPAAQTACRIVETVATDQRITRVEHILARCGIGERTLQRLFKRYVGASARWVIKRYRVYEALERVSTSTRLDWASVAQELGYFDQAHFINDFRKLVGRTPAEYLRPSSTGG